MKTSSAMFLLALGAVSVGIVSCTHAAAPKAAEASAVNEFRKAEETARPEIDLVPLPSKSRYLTVHTRSGWENPFVTVQGDALLLRVTDADANSSPIGQGGLLRPAGARRHDLALRLHDLPEALAALPPGAWPYGRVVAVEEMPAPTPELRRKVRRNVEQTIQMLSELGIVIDEWNEPIAAGR